MIDHIGITVSDIEKSRGFYAKTSAPLGYVLGKANVDAVSFVTPGEQGENTDPGGDFWLSKGTPMTPRVHFAFNAASRADVDAFFAAGLSAGGVENGVPKIRDHYHPRYYAAFLLDPDGYNIEAVCHAG